MDHKSIIKTSLLISVALALLSVLSNLISSSIPDVLVVLLSFSSFGLVVFCERLAFRKGKSNFIEYLIENTEFVTELLIFSATMLVFANFMPLEFIYISLILVAANYYIGSSSSRVLGRQSVSATKYKQRTSLLIASMIFSLVTSVLGFYLVLIFLLTHLYTFYSYIS